MLSEILIQAVKVKEISAFFCHSPIGVCKYAKPSLRLKAKKDRVQIKVNLIKIAI